MTTEAEINAASEAVVKAFKVAVEVVETAGRFLEKTGSPNPNYLLSYKEELRKSGLKAQEAFRHIVDEFRKVCDPSQGSAHELAYDYVVEVCEVLRELFAMWQESSEYECSEWLAEQLDEIEIDPSQTWRLMQAERVKAVKGIRSDPPVNDLVSVKDLESAHKWLDPSRAKGRGTFRTVLKCHHHKPEKVDKDGTQFWHYGKVLPTLQTDDRVKVVGGDNWPGTIQGFREIVRKSENS